MADKVIRITKAQRFEDIKALLTGGEVKHGTDVDKALEVIDHELELLAKKNSSDNKKQTETQKLNASIKEQLVAFLGELDDSNPGLTCTEIIKGKGWLEDYSVSKISSLLRQLKDDGQVVSKTVKGKTLFTLA